ncbi:MAG TPA: hypothetical protein VFL86_21415 [Burkholderiaceae bacterium]|nr:hypothetical protein [Burkholderiaceae bacterium]
MSKHGVDATIPEIRFRPSAEVYAKASRFAEALGLTLTDVARMGLAQLAHTQQLSLVPEAPRALRELPIHGTTAGSIADIASAAARNAVQDHVQAGRLPANHPTQSPEY